MMTDANNVPLSKREAFDAMRAFLQAYWDRFNGASLSDVLSDMQPAFLADTVTADPAAWEDWTKAVDLVISNSIDRR